MKRLDQAIAKDVISAATDKIRPGKTFKENPELQKVFFDVGPAWSPVLTLHQALADSREGDPPVIFELWRMNMIGRPGLNTEVTEEIIDMRSFMVPGEKDSYRILVKKQT